MRCGKEFFDLQIRFAHAAACVVGVPLAQALLEYTNLYIRFGLGRAADRDHPVWRRYIDGLNGTTDIGAWTYRFFIDQANEVRPPSVVATFGCFSYACEHADRIRIHFDNVEPLAISPLNSERLSARLYELRSLFEHARRTQRNASKVVGVSWLYNLRAYRRCFPGAYVASARVAEPRFRNMPLWGQFLDRHGEVRPATADAFLQRLARAKSIDDLAHSFPWQALSVEAPIDEFYRFHEIEDIGPRAPSRAADKKPPSN